MHKILRYVFLSVCSNERDLITRYFWLGFRYSTIIRILAEYHNLSFSDRTLRRRLADYGLHRRGHLPALRDVWDAVHAELRGPGKRYYKCIISNDTLGLAVSLLRLRSVNLSSNKRTCVCVYVWYYHCVELYCRTLPLQGNALSLLTTLSVEPNITPG